MSVMAKVQELVVLRKKNLEKLKEDIQIKQLDLEIQKDELTEKLKEQREIVIKKVENKDINGEKIERLKLNDLETTYKEKVEAFKDNLETLKAIEQIFKLKEERKSIIRSRLYGAFGVIFAGGGIALAYGSDTFGTLFNKKTYDSAKALLLRILPKP